MFAGISICGFFLVNYLGTWFMFAGIYFCDFNVVAKTKLPKKSLANINEFTVYIITLCCKLT